MKRRYLVLTFVMLCIVVCLTLLSCGRDSSCKVSFDTNGGTRVSSVRVEKGEKVSKPRAPYKEGYQFEGWYIEDEKWSFVGYIVTEDITLEARYLPLTYSIEYVGAKTNGPAEYTTEDTISLEKGYGDYLEFCGWYLDDEYTKPIEKIEKGTTGNLTLYAKTETRDLVFGAINDNEWVVLDVNPEAINVIIPDKIDNKSVTRIGKGAFSKCTNLKNVSLGKSLEEIEQEAFLNCKSLLRITGGEKLSIIGDNAFSGCSALGNISLGYNVTKIGKGAFSGCASLVSIYIPLKTKEVGKGAFSGCYNLQIYCEAGTMPQEWDEAFQESRLLVSWGYNERIGLDFALGEGGYFVEGITATRDEVSNGIIIPSVYDGLNVVGIAEGTFKNCYDIEWISIPSTIEHITPGAFNGCVSLKTIDVSSSNKNYKSLYGSLYTKNGDTLVKYAQGKQDVAFAVPYSVRLIEKYAFSGAEYLETVEIWSSSIGEGAFANCNNLKWVSICGDSTAITIGDGAFESCDNLATVLFLYGESGELYDILEDADAEFGNINLTAIGKNAFKDCVSLKKITIPKNVISIGDGGFENCNSLEEITLGTSLKSLGTRVFYGCVSLKSISVAKTNEFFTSIDGNLYTKDQGTLVQYAPGKESTSFKIPEGVVEICQNAFDSCETIREISLPNSIRIIDKKTFYPCTYLSYNRGVNGYYLGNKENPYLVLIEADNTQIMQISMSTKVIAGHAFEYCDLCTVVNIPEGVSVINDKAFLNCYNLTSARLPSTLEYIGANAFENCRSISSLQIPDNVKHIGDRAFSGCRQVELITIGKGVEYIGNYVFTNMVFLEKITIPSSVKEIGKGFLDGCSQIKEILVEEGNECFVSIEGNLYTIDKRTIVRYASGKTEATFTIPEEVTKIGDFAFQCNHLESIVIPSGVTSIGEYAFAGAYVLKEVELSEGILELGKGAFKSCDKLESINLPDGIRTIGDECFAFCTSLKEITIPNSTEYVGEHAFLGCTGMKAYLKLQQVPQTWDINWAPNNIEIVFQANN